MNTRVRYDESVIARNNSMGYVGSDTIIRTLHGRYIVLKPNEYYDSADGSIRDYYSGRILWTKEQLMGPMPEPDMDWKNEDWLRVYKYLLVAELYYREKANSHNNYFIVTADISNLMKKLEFMFREQDSE